MLMQSCYQLAIKNNGLFLVIIRGLVILDAYPAYHHDRESVLIPSDVQVISEEDIAAEKYTIEDIILPLPG